MVGPCYAHVRGGEGMGGPCYAHVRGGEGDGRTMLYMHMSGVGRGW